MKPSSSIVYVECPSHGGESIVEVEHDHGARYGGQSEQLWVAVVVTRGCDCEPSDIQDRAIAQMEDEC